jgi:hypothetical protein
MSRVPILLDQLDRLRHEFGSKEARQVVLLLNRLARTRLADAESILRFHETLLFLRAYPHSPSVVHATELALRAFPKRIVTLNNNEVDLSILEHPERSGIAGMSVTDTFSYPIVRWLLQCHPNQVALDWEWFEDENRLAETWPRFMPLLDEDALVEANVPYQEWLRQARGSCPSLGWLVARFETLQPSEKGRAELYDSQRIYVRWTPRYQHTRTGLRSPSRSLYYHQSPLIQRRDVDFAAELAGPSPLLRKLSRSEGEKSLDLAREASTIRYRELYGFTHGDPGLVHHADLGRGIDLVIFGLAAEKRLPLRAYVAAMIYKNRVPIGYFEGLSIFERMESGFNLYYTFRDGETAWLYSKTLNIMRQFTGVTAFTLDPYQVGHENEEGIESGAFWFYRKLGFRPTERSVLRITEKEELKIHEGKGYRTRAATLRKLAESPMILELEKTRVGDWDRFQVRKIGLAVQRLMSSKFNGESERLRTVACKLVGQALDIRVSSLSQLQTSVFSDFAVVLLLVPDLKDWSEAEKKSLSQIIRAKASKNETKYLKLMQTHERFRRAIIQLGSLSDML